MYYANHAAFDKKAQKILKTAMRYKVIKSYQTVPELPHDLRENRPHKWTAAQYLL